MVILYTGDGKGKTTAALGAALRAIGNGAKVVMYQFIKGPWLSGEDFLAAALNIPSSIFQVIKGGKGFVGILGDTLPFSEHKKAAQDTLNQAAEAAKSKEYDLIVLDEVNVAVGLKLLEPKQVVDIIKRNNTVDFILTGRGAPKEFYEIADIVSEIKSIKHRFDEGELAKKGLEY